MKWNDFIQLFSWPFLFWKRKIFLSNICYLHLLIVVYIQFFNIFIFINWTNLSVRLIFILISSGLSSHHSLINKKIPTSLEIDIFYIKSKTIKVWTDFSMVQAKGLEPPCREALDPKSSASTNFATPAYTI